jgi:hypothetical protein
MRLHSRDLYGDIRSGNVFFSFFKLKLLFSFELLLINMEDGILINLDKSNKINQN